MFKRRGGEVFFIYLFICVFFDGNAIISNHEQLCFKTPFQTCYILTILALALFSSDSRTRYTLVLKKRKEKRENRRNHQWLKQASNLHSLLASVYLNSFNQKYKKKTYKKKKSKQILQIEILITLKSSCTKRSQGSSYNGGGKCVNKQPSSKQLQPPKLQTLDSTTYVESPVFLKLLYRNTIHEPYLSFFLSFLFCLFVCLLVFFF